MFKLIDIQLTDFAWLQTLCDMEELDASLELLKLQMKCRPHLKTEKRAFGLEHLKQVN